MRKFGKRCLSLALAACLTLALLPGVAFAGNPEGLTYQNTHVNTGNQRQDMVAVALTQLGYREVYDNDTKFGDWSGYPYQPWCATFISWCARQAEVSTDILKESARAKPSYFGIKYYHGSKYTPQPGDLFFTSGFEHVGLVYRVEGSYFYTLEGNANEYDLDAPPTSDGDSYFVVTNKRRISNHYFGVPNYKGTDKAHTYVKGEDAGHPHKEYYRCTTCGDQYYTGYTAVHNDCSKCMSCGCKASGAGYYMVYNYHDPIRIRTSHSTAVDYIGYATQGEVVYVYGTSNGWAYIDFDGKRGHIKTQYLKKYHDIPDSPRISVQTDYTLGEDVTITWDSPANTEQFRLKILQDGSIYREKVMDLNRTYTLTDLPAGVYEVQVTAVNRSGLSPAGMAVFTVRDVYTLTYDAGGGIHAPAPQTQPLGTAAVVTDAVPIRLGFSFLGWMDEDGSLYAAGDSVTAQDHITLYPLWLENQTSEVLPEPEEHIHSWSGCVRADDNSHQRTCTLCGEVETEDHGWDEGLVLQFPTCAQTGLMEHTCTTCGAQRQEVLPVTGEHAWGQWNETDSSSHIRLCDLCGHEDRGAHCMEESWSWDDKEHFHRCMDCGSVQDREDHIPVPGGSLEDPRFCGVCGVELLPAVTYEQIVESRYAQSCPRWMVGITRTVHLAGVLLG